MHSTQRPSLGALLAFETTAESDSFASIAKKLFRHLPSLAKKFKD